jgi:hypothetical protein
MTKLAGMDLSEFKREPFNGPEIAVGEILAQV